jgi:hypothetical protein
VKRVGLIIGASTLVLALLLGGAALVARDVLSAKVAEAAGPMMLLADLPAEIRGLHDLPPEQRFEHFLGVQAKFTDTGNTSHTVAVTPATVTSVSGDKLSVTVNDGGASKSYNLTSDTRIHQAGGRPWSGGQTQQATLKSGDRVVVVTLDGSNDAKAVMIGGANGFGPGPGGAGFHGGPFHQPS